MRARCRRWMRHAGEGASPPLTLFPSSQVCMALEEEFSIAIPDAEAEKILSAEDAIAFVSTHPSAK